MTRRPNRRLLRILTLAAALVALTAGAAAASPTTTLTVAVPNTTVPAVEFGKAAKLTVQLTSDVPTVAVASQPVTLFADAFPFDGVYVPVATGTTSATGAATFQPKPVRNTTYRVDWSATDTATTPAVAVTASSLTALVYTDLAYASYRARFLANGHVAIDAKLRTDPTINLSKMQAFAYVRFDNKGSFFRRSVATPKTTGSLRYWKFNFLPPGALKAKNAQIFICAQDHPERYGIGRPGAFAKCGAKALTPAQASAVLSS
jgi:hypothetical protein